MSPSMQKRKSPIFNGTPLTDYQGQRTFNNKKYLENKVCLTRLKKVLSNISTLHWRSEGFFTGGVLKIAICKIKLNADMRYIYDI